MKLHLRVYIVTRKYNELYKFEIGDKYSIWIELDPSFSEEEYTFKWVVEKTGVILNTKSKLDLDITEKMVAEKQTIYCTITSTKSWHKYGNYDQQFAIVFQILPPRE